MNIQDIRQGSETIVELLLKKGQGKLPKTPLPVRLVRDRKSVIVTPLNDEIPFEAKPADKKNRNELDRLLTRNLPSLSVLLAADRDGQATVSVKTFADEKPMDISVGVDDGFLEKARKQAKLNYSRNPEDGLNEMFVVRLKGLQYAVMGIHLESGGKDLNHFILAGSKSYVQVNRYTDEEGGVYFTADHLLNRIDESKYAFTLIKGSIKFVNATSMEKARMATVAAMSELGGSIEGYLNTWDQYSKIEQEITYEKASKAGAVPYSGWDYIDANRVRLHVEGGPKLAEFAKVVKRKTAITMCKNDPSGLFDKFDPEWYRGFLKGQEGTATVTVAADIEVSEERVYVIKFPEDAPPPKSGYIFMSLNGDIERFRRRTEARDAILNGRNHMPQLAAILEAKSVALPGRQYHEPISLSVKTDIFPTNDPTPTQKEAIEIAINTPDIAIIQGPPGTGKTTVIRAILKRLNEIGDSSGGLFGQNLVTAYQHDAVQNAVERIDILGMPAIKIGSRSGSQDDNAQVIELMVENWINERLDKLYDRYPDIVKNDYMSRFDDIYNNYLYSTNTVESTLRLLEEMRALIGSNVSIELLQQLDRIVSELRMTAPSTQEPERKFLIQSIRRIPVTRASYSDNGREVLMETVYRLKQSAMPDFEQETGFLEKVIRAGQPDADTFAQLRAVRKKILSGLIPEENIFHTPKQKDEILELFGRLSDYLREQFNKTKFGEDAVLQQYISEYANSPLAVRNSVLQYVSVLGVTNQQVAGLKVTTMKGDTQHYDNVLVDEAARSNPLDLFIPMALARDRIILVGDHRQLPHIVDEAIANQLEKNAATEGNEALLSKVNENVKKSMFQHLFHVLKKLEKADGIKRTITLDKQYRTHPVLGDFVSKNFYERHGEVYVESPLPAEKFAHQLPGLENKACVWYDVPFVDGGEVGGQSKRRPAEAAAIALHLKKMMDSDAAKGLSFGVIAFYREQVEEIYKEMEKVGIAERGDGGDNQFVIETKYREDTTGRKKIEKLRIGTVDSFQGMEFDVVYLSMVRSNRLPDATPWHKRSKYGHLMVENRLCVSMSRQKRLLIVAGDSGMLQGPEAEVAVPALVNYYSLCQGEQTYGKII